MNSSFCYYLFIFLNFLFFNISYTLAGESSSASAFDGFMTSFGNFVPLIVIMLIFYFIIIRPQQKKNTEHHNSISKLKFGDEIILNNFIYGKFVEFTGEKIASVYISDNAIVKVTMDSITHILDTKSNISEEKKQLNENNNAKQIQIKKENKEKKKINQKNKTV